MAVVQRVEPSVPLENTPRARGASENKPPHEPLLWGGVRVHYEVMRRLAWFLLLTLTVAADPTPAPISSYSFQGPKRKVQRTSQRHSPRPPSVSHGPAALPIPRLPQQTPPGPLRVWGGTIVAPSHAGPCFITSNGPIPSRSIVCIGRGQRYLGQAQVLSSDSRQAELQLLGSLSLQPGDWVSLVSVPAPVRSAPPTSTATRPSYHSYHPTSSNADPRYQQWLRRGFTLGRVYRGNPYRSSCSRYQ